MFVPKVLKNWFIIHFIVDILLAIPLMFFPEVFLSYLGWTQIDPLTTRLVAAALFAIGIESFICRNGSVETFKNMLTLKIIWSSAAILGLILSYFVLTELSLVILSLIIIFVLFNILWWYWRLRLNK